jgi:hypothetical protein
MFGQRHSAHIRTLLRLGAHHVGRQGLQVTVGSRVSTIETGYAATLFDFCHRVPCGAACEGSLR